MLKEKIDEVDSEQEVEESSQSIRELYGHEQISKTVFLSCSFFCRAIWLGLCLCVFSALPLAFLLSCLLFAQTTTRGRKRKRALRSLRGPVKKERRPVSILAFFEPVFILC